jgi:uncharacterized membrane protein
MSLTVLRTERLLCVLLLFAGAAGVLPAQAASYTYTPVDFPGAASTQVFGINKQGQIVGTAAFDTGNGISFVYDTGTRAFTVLANVPGLDTGMLGINDKGVTAGSVADPVTGASDGAILDQGAFTFFAHPAEDVIQARGINNKGLVAGFGGTPGQSTFGFIYDTQNGSFVEFLPSAFTIAQGISDQGEVVGSTILSADEAYTGSPPGQYGFLRDAQGSVTLFRVNGLPTRARGIAKSGRVVGFVVGPDEIARGYVTSLGPATGYQDLSVADADLLEFPSASGTFLQDIDDGGRIVGQWWDADSNTHSFLATPKSKGKKK